MAFFRNESIWLFTPLIMWIAGIFYFSSSKGSFSRTLPCICSFISGLLFPRSDQVTLTNHYLAVRKLLHFLVMGSRLLASIALGSSSLHFLATLWHLLSFAIVIVAAVDEGRQCFSPDRVGSLSDVALDGVGGLTAILLFWIFTLSFFR
ncbi:MAG: VanZ family protein [Chloracidobacterium sp.]|nr:VanZ family protein [Chloracidobacterium sp.]